METTKKGTSRSCSTWLLDIFRPGKRSAKSTIQQLSRPHPRPAVPEQSFALFLDLPRELRDKIYEICLFNPLPNRQISHSEAIRRYDSTKSTQSFNCVKYPPNPPYLTGSPLLLCNRQINAEVQDAMSRLETHSDLHYVLDCELIGERYIYPSWLLLPVFTKRIPFVYVNLRSTGVAYPSYYRGWLGNGGPPSMIWGLLEILQRFSLHGPHFAAKSSQRKDVFIDTLILDVLPCGNNVNSRDGTVDDEEPAARPFELEEWVRAESPVSGRTVTSEDPVLEALLKYVSWLFIDERDTTPHAKNVAGAVRKIHLLHDGVEVRSWDTQSYEHLKDVTVP